MLGTATQLSFVREFRRTAPYALRSANPPRVSQRSDAQGIPAYKFVRAPVVYSAQSPRVSR